MPTNARDYSIFNRLMKPTISFILQTSNAAIRENTDAIARNVLDGIISILDSANMRCSLFLDGKMLNALSKAAKALSLGKIKAGIREGRIEFLGGSFHDAMLPLFPEELQLMQLKSHRDATRKIFDAEPAGYFNSSMVWETEMTETLAKTDFDFAVVAESAIQEVLDCEKPVAGWFTTEDKGSLMRLVPVSERLSCAIEDDDIRWKEILEPYCSEGKFPVVVLRLPENPADIYNFFQRLMDFVETNDIQTWTVGHIVNQMQPSGCVSSFTSVGKTLGLPEKSRTCRDLLIRRPEVNALHKLLLSIYRQINNLLEVSDKDRVFLTEKLLPAMAPMFYCDLAEGKGMRSPEVCWQGFRYLLWANNDLNHASNASGLRLDVSDFLFTGKKFIWAENPEIGFLMDYYGGGSLRTLIFKPTSLNLQTPCREDNEPSVSLLDFLLPSAEWSATQMQELLLQRKFALRDAYDYQIKRGNGMTDISLVGEQPYAFDSEKGLLHLEKNFTIHHERPRFSLNYKLENSTYVNVAGMFGTLMEVGMRSFDEKSQAVRINDKKVDWNGTAAEIFSAVKSIEVTDKILSCRLRLDFDAEAELLFAPISGGVQIFPYWKVSLESLQAENIKVNVSLSRRTLFR